MTDIAVIDDDTDFCEMINDALVEDGKKVVCCFDYDDAEHEILFSQSSPKVILMDVNLPSANGFEACELLKSRLDYNPSVIFVSGFSSIEDKLRALSCGGDDFIEKPLDLGLLKAKINTAIDTVDRRESLESSVKNMRDSMFQAMKQSSDLGLLIRFLESSIEAQSFEQLAEFLFEMLQEFELSASMAIFDDEGEAEYFFPDKIERPLEKQVLSRCNGKNRLYDFGCRTIVNEHHCSILLRNMPLDNEERYGMLRDSICFIAAAVSSRVSQIVLQRNLNTLLQRVTISTDVITHIMSEMDNDVNNLINEGTTATNEMVMKMEEEFMLMNITNVEEERLLDHLNKCGDGLHNMFVNNNQRQDATWKMLEQLADTLRT